MPTDAEILRDMAANVGVDYYGIAVDPALLGFDDDEAGLAAVIATLTRVADALEENARLRSLLATVRRELLAEANAHCGTSRGDAAGNLVATIDGTVWDADAFASGGADALRKPDAAD